MRCVIPEHYILSKGICEVITLYMRLPDATFLLLSRPSYYVSPKRDVGAQNCLPCRLTRSKEFKRML
jgi:hypothetical protein